MSLSKRQITLFQQKILSWYAAHKRDLPWRKTRDPYKILVSEVMLQQTQVSRVIPKYHAWIAAFPTVAALASATTADVLRLWSGLGYNKRALYLQEAAKSIQEGYKGHFPKDSVLLKKFPGIGEYTAHAVMCFAFGVQVAVVDTNIRKVISIEFFGGNIPGEEVIEEVAKQVLPKGNASIWNQALMDYAGAMLKKKKILRQSRTKQSKFIGSNRYYRGKLIRLLLQEREIPLAKLGFLLKEEFGEKDMAWLNAIVNGLQKDRLIVLHKDVVMIAGKQ